MSEIPPKQSPDAAPGGNMVTMYNASSQAGGESFPVLKAFQDYVDAERSQARRRVIQLSITFSVLLVFIVAGFLLAGMMVLRNMSSVQERLLDVVVTGREARPAPAVPAAEVARPVPAPEPAVADATPVIEASLQRVATELQSAVGKKLDDVSDITTKVHERIATQDGELEKLREELRAMQEQSLRLRDELAAVKEAEAHVLAAVRPATRLPDAPAPAAATRPAAPAAAAAGANATPAPAVTVEATKPPPERSDVKPPAPPEGMMATSIQLKTRNMGEISWRVMIPE